MNACEMSVPCFDQANARPSNELAGHNGMALGNLGEGEGSQGRLRFELVAVVLTHVLAQRDLATLFKKGGEKGDETSECSDRSGTCVVHVSANTTTGSV
jgi:hypothetical protein